MNLLKGKNLIKLHNCFNCHLFKKKNSFYKKIPKIKYQRFDYIVWTLIQYKNLKNNFYNRNNFIMSTQIQNLSLSDIKFISFFLSKIFIILKF